MTCPFCQERVEGEYAMMLHMESLHPDNDSPPYHLVNTTEDQLPPSGCDDDDDTEYTECPVDGCGELLTNEMIDFHAELHGAEDSSSNLNGKEAAGPAQHLETRGSSSSGPSRSHREADRHRRAKAEGSSSKHPKLSLRSFFRMPNYFAHHHDGASKSRSKSGGKAGGRSEGKSSATSGVTAGLRRLGKSQLGQHANEDRMPDSLVSLLKTGVGYNHLEGVVPVVAQMLQQSAATRNAYLCHPCVQHISKLRKEGGFCGYRNIQMLCSYIVSVGSPGYNNINRHIPSIFQIQDYIESAWDAGINTQGRIETGGIRGTRKYIGTPEALAMFRLLDIPCEAQGFKNPEPGKSEALLYEHVENYFRSGALDPMAKVRQTNLPPLYFQHAGHSMTIIGTERLLSGETQLLVFDPSFKDSSEVRELVGHELEVRSPDKILRQYRRGSYLRKFKEFEVLRQVLLHRPLCI
ncbi:peptidase family C78-domain-containing protein [Schizothecium vesticola]|uniref:Peptidase family C78-domain-containing protein n=1 Tax=Schizothecium vesticola TaxID=314040 RepID=A0AA40KDE6_9PEZI|nr:peptidase family C78-domain-containing protein [Schizothecium vesticola]